MLLLLWADKLKNLESICEASGKLKMIMKRVVTCSLFLLASACSGGGGGSSPGANLSPAAPSNTAPSLSAIGDKTISEGTVSVATLSATDSDGDSLSFSVSGTDAALFDIDPSTNLVFRDPPDFETPLDANTGNDYELSVVVSDGTLSTSESFVVRVVDLLDGRLVDGPVSGAEVTLMSSDEIAATDSDGYFLFSESQLTQGQQVIAQGGIDAFTGNELPDLFLTSTLLSDSQVVQINAISTLISEAPEGERQQVLDGLGIESTVPEFAVTDIWEAADSGSALGMNAQKLNFQISFLLSAFQILAEVANTEQRISAVKSLAQGIAELTSERTGVTSLAKELILRELVNSALSDLNLTVSSELLGAVAGALADLNTVLGGPDFSPTSEVARQVNSVLQTELRAALETLLIDRNVELFRSGSSPAVLFADIDSSSSPSDIDGDGLSDLLDADDDGDGVRDGDDAFPDDGDETKDTDGDGTGNNADMDDDGDGVMDLDDAFPLDADETVDSDGDGIGDNRDSDDDNDGVDDQTDAFPQDPAASLDSDGDGYPDFWNDNATAEQIAASPLILDAFPDDGNEFMDTDGDGVGNNSDEDDDNDGTIDEEDIDPLDPSVTGFVLSGQITVNSEIIIDSDTNDPSNTLERDNEVGNYYPVEQLAQPLEGPFIVHGYANKPLSGPQGPLFEIGDEDDFFAVNALAGQRFLLDIGDYRQGDLDFYLFDENLQIVSGSESAGPNELIIAPEDGLYFVNVYAWGGFSNYTLTTDFGGGVQSTIRVKPNEIILQLDENKFDDRAARNKGFDRLVRDHALSPAAQSMTGKHRLFVINDVSAAAAEVADHPKIKKMTRPARLRSVVDHKIKRLLKDPDVQSAQPNFLYFPHATTNDPRRAEMWHLDQINIGEAWDTTTGDPSVVVAVIDTGTLSDHPDLVGHVSEGYDFIAFTSNSDGDGIDPDPEDSHPLVDVCDDVAAFYHGAHVSGTIGATGDNEEGIVGVAYGARLMHLRALDGGCGGSTYGIVQSLLYAIGAENDSGSVPDNPATIVNMSLGGGGSDNFFESTIDLAIQSGVIIVASSGNSGSRTVSYPARYQGVIAVGSTGLDGEVPGYSNRGANLMLVAPGGGSGGEVLSLNKSSLGYVYAGASGTSMAAPHASGVFALMKSVHPNLTPQRLNGLISAGVLTEDIGPAGFDELSGWGRIDAAKAIAVAVDDANGTFKMPARIVLSNNELYFGGETTSTDVRITNPGDIGLTVSSISVSDSWIQVSESLDVNLDEVGRWKIIVDRSDLPAGFYSGAVTFLGADDTGNSLSADLYVYLRVGKIGLGNLGSIKIAIRPKKSDGDIVVSSSTIENDYSYKAIVPEAGMYTVIAGTDVDNGGEICGIGDACSTSDGETPQEIDVTGPVSGIDLVVSLPVEEK